MATIKDVARLSGVSVSTVSIILNGQARARKISTKTEKKVLEAIKELNYNPSVSARKLRSNEEEKYTIGIYWALDFTTGFLARFINGIQNEILKSKLPVTTVICPFESNNLKNEKALKSMSTYNAVLIANINVSDREFLNENQLPIPAIIVNRQFNNYHTVCIDNKKAGETVANHMLSRGLRDIGMVVQGGNEAFYGMKERGLSFFETFKKRGVDISKENVVRVENSLSGGVKAGEYFLNKGNIPKGIFVDSDVMAQGLMHCFNRNGINVPNDCEIVSVGIGPKDFSEHFTPSITVVDMPIEEMGSQCIKLISEILEHNIEDEKKHILLDTNLIVRESSPAI
ncbi:MAG: LacI family DNA-binding transcriptional regulator [Tyzzerella sp.]|uniref:LacI family DNA-binding transcriptional regulator n=1 Tax=Candidatus Fimicola merdigallinarum TaxID=2840819 RepID=A0A9D9H2N8_9FIRM|nr:LacI family DNA-binding transcriptional regulator [Candidatus Fimicola merdigallinarum]